MESPLIFIGFAVFFIAILVLAILQSWQREKEMREWGEKNGLRYSKKDSRLDDEFPLFSCLRRGHSRYGKHILTGALRNYPVCAFDYHYTTGSGKNKQHHSFSALMINTGLPLKPLFIRTENLFDKVTELAGFDDIDFESAEFSREFYVKSPDKRWAYDVLHQKTMEFLLLAPRFTLEFQGPYVMAYRGRTFKIPDFEDAFAVVTQILKLLPDYLKREWKGDV